MAVDLRLKRKRHFTTKLIKSMVFLDDFDFRIYTYNIALRDV